MATFNKRKFSASSDGRMVKIVATATPGTLIHTATSGAAADDDYDELWLYAVNSDTTARKLTVELGGVTAPDDLIEQTIPPEAGLILVVPGFPLQGAVSTRAFAAAANVVMAGGYVNRLSP